MGEAPEHSKSAKKHLKKEFYTLLGSLIDAKRQKSATALRAAPPKKEKILKSITKSKFWSERKRPLRVCPKKRKLPIGLLRAPEKKQISRWPIVEIPKTFEQV